jgi:voltage-gated potassium channel
MMVMLESDTETLLTVLTARSRNRDIYITATAHDDLTVKIDKVGANNVLAPFDLAGQFLNNATLRPAVNMFFTSILFHQDAREQIVQLFIWEESAWVGSRLDSLQLRNRFATGVLGLRLTSGGYLYVPGGDHVLQPGEVILAVTPGALISALQQECYRGLNLESHSMHLERLPTRQRFQTGDKRYSLLEAEGAIKDLSQHFVICGDGPTLRNALGHLNPDRPFVFVSNNNALTSEMLKRGFRVVHGDPTQEDTLSRAGVGRALATMVSMEDNADQVLTVLNCRIMSDTLLITATANSDEMIPKLHRAGADRVISPFRIAAQFILLATTRPAVSDFMQYVLFNYEAGIETTELYMQDNSPWIGQTIEELQLRERYRAGVTGVRLANGRFLYAPRGSHKIAENEVLLVTTPMEHSDELRVIAHGSETKRPTTLRPETIRQTGIWSLDLLNEGNQDA